MILSEYGTVDIRYHHHSFILILSTLLFHYFVCSDCFKSHHSLSAVTTYTQLSSPAQPFLKINTITKRSTRNVNHVINIHLLNHPPRLIKMSSLEDIIGETSSFLDNVVASCEAKGINIKDHQIDHLCYRCSSKEEYLDVCQRLSSRCIGTLLVEGMIGGRPISTFDLIEPLSFQTWTIPSLEVASPKAGRQHHVGLEHIEVVIGLPSDEPMHNREQLEQFAALYPHIQFDRKAIDKVVNADISIDVPPHFTVKFHVCPLNRVCLYERSHQMVDPVPEDYFSSS